VWVEILHGNEGLASITNSWRNIATALTDRVLGC